MSELPSGAALNAPVGASRLYGSELAASFGADAPAPAIVTRTMPHAALAVTELRVDKPAGRISDALPPDDAYLVAHELRTYKGMEYWEGGRHRATYGLRAGDTTITDLRREPQVKFEVPVHCMLWLVPRAALDALADEAGAPRIDGLPHGPGAGFADETVRQLNLVAMATLERPRQASRSFVDYLNLAFAAHIAERYGGLGRTARPTKGGLAPWQERRAKEMLVADFAGTTTLVEIANACGLSAGHFARAFRRSTGVAPHAWLLRARIEHAMMLLRRPGASLCEVALACGFADQSHFSRVFARQTGQSPRHWRRMAMQ
jgi:AraC-like DNA-binding protein